MLNNKKAQELSVGTLILIVLGIIILVLLVLGFSMGWTNLWDKINIFGGGSTIGDVITACNLQTISQETYCNDFKKININGKIEYVNCDDSRVVSEISDRKTCDSITMSDAKIAKCRSLNKNETKVNGNACGDILLVAGSTPKCEGNVMACSEIRSNDNSACTRQKGCTWTTTNICTGTSTPCSSLLETDCRTQSGCIWR